MLVDVTLKHSSSFSVRCNANVLKIVMLLRWLLSITVLSKHLTFHEFTLVLTQSRLLAFSFQEFGIFNLLAHINLL